MFRAVTPDFGAMAEKQYYLEGAFRRMHVRLRTHAESVAFFGGGEREGRTVSAAFTSLQVSFGASVELARRLHNAFSMAACPARLFAPLGGAAFFRLLEQYTIEQ